MERKTKLTLMVIVIAIAS